VLDLGEGSPHQIVSVINDAVTLLVLGDGVPFSDGATLARFEVTG
jgi:hypothetical protein